jgi:hypothetical protein
VLLYTVARRLVREGETLVQFPITHTKKIMDEDFEQFVMKELNEWVHPCGKHAHKFLPPSMYQQEADKYYMEVMTSSNRLQSDWGFLIEEFKQRARARGVYPTDRALVLHFLQIFDRFMYNE